MKILRLVTSEPALVVGFVLAVIGVATAFGLGITKGQSDAIVALVGAVLAFLGSVVTRSQVSPAAKRDARGRFTKDEAGATTLELIATGCLIVLVLILLAALGVLH